VTILVTGAGGQLGTALRGHLPTQTLFTTREGDSGVDLATPKALSGRLDALRPSIIINAAAYTAVDAAESDERGAFTVNADAVGAIGRWAARHGAFVIHVSTDYVFDGLGTAPYREDHAISPVNTYGRSKAAGEQALRESGARHAILRTAWLYGPTGHNFLRTMLRLGAERERLRVVDDQTGSPTSVDVVSSAIARVIARMDESGTVPSDTFHVACQGQTTWHGFAQAIFARATALGTIPRAPEVDPVATSDYPTPAARPRYSVLDPTHFERTFGLQLPAWEQALEDTLDQLNP
jgi:dTDP-4-dehydrorhamnose reductase